MPHTRSKPPRARVFPSDVPTVWRDVFEHSPDLVSYFGPGFRHVWVNSAVVRDTGIPAEDFVGKTNADLGMPGDLVSFWESKLREAFESGCVVTIDFEYTGPAGLKSYVSRLLPVCDPATGGTSGVLVICIDKTAKVQALADLKKAKEAAEAALEEVRKLQSILPICSYCKKVKRDESYWQQIEEFVSKNYKTSFSHGICPDCMREVVGPQLRELGISLDDSK